MCYHTADFRSHYTLNHHVILNLGAYATHRLSIILVKALLCVAAYHEA